MPASDIRDILEAIQSIRSALLNARNDAIPHSRRVQELVEATLRACLAFDDLMNDDEFWLELQIRGYANAKNLFDLKKLIDEISHRGTKDRIMQLMIVLGMGEEEAIEFIRGLIYNLEQVMRTDHDDIDQLTFDRAFTVAESITSELCDKGRENSDELKRKLLQKRIFREIITTLSGSITSLGASVLSMSVLPDLSKRFDIAQLPDFNNNEKELVVAMFYAATISLQQQHPEPEPVYM